MFRKSVRAAGVAALFSACVLCSPLARAGNWNGWSPKKSQRETLHPNDCQFGYYGTGWRAWPEGCDRGYGCTDRFAPPMTPSMWSPSMSPNPNMPAPNWSIPPQSESPNPWSTLPPIPQTTPPTWGPQLPPPSYGPVPVSPQSVPTAPANPTSPPAPIPPLPMPQVPPATQRMPNNPAPFGQPMPVPPLPTTMAPSSRGSTSAVTPAGGWNRSVPATLSAPEFGPLSVQPMSYSAPPRWSNSVSKGLIQPSRRPAAPVTLLAPEF